MERLKNSIVFVLADMVEGRDEGTGGHIERTTLYIKILLDAMLERGVYVDEICDIDYDLFSSSARLHDVGKVKISDNILNKPGKLTDDEFSVMKTHTMMGEQVIDKIVSRTGDDEAFLLHAKLFSGCHHERWDGKGYPNRLSAKNIPLEGRLMAFADVYDALISERPYKKAFSHEEAVKIIMDGAGTQFDPFIADVFFEIKDQFSLVKSRTSERTLLTKE